MSPHSAFVLPKPSAFPTSQLGNHRVLLPRQIDSVFDPGVPHDFSAVGIPFGLAGPFLGDDPLDRDDDGFVSDLFQSRVDTIKRRIGRLVHGFIPVNPTGFGNQPGEEPTMDTHWQTPPRALGPTTAASSWWSLAPSGDEMAVNDPCSHGLNLVLVSIPCD